jgi:hypothetical protein
VIKVVVVVRVEGSPRVFVHRGCRGKLLTRDRRRGIVGRYLHASLAGLIYPEDGGDKEDRF